VQHAGAGLRDRDPLEVGCAALAALDVGREHAVVVLGEHERLALLEGGVLAREAGEGRCGRAQPDRCAGDEHVGREAAADLLEDAGDVGARAVDLVDEQQGGDPLALERAHEDPGLGLHPLDGREDQNRAVEHPERALDLGDEVRVAGGVDDVDGDVVDLQRDDGGLDGDAAPSFDGEAVGAGGAGVDRAGLVDDPCEVQEPLGQGGLTGVDVGEDAQIERPCGHA